MHHNQWMVKISLEVIAAEHRTLFREHGDAVLLQIQAAAGLFQFLPGWRCSRSWGVNLDKAPSAYSSTRFIFIIIIFSC